MMSAKYTRKSSSRRAEKRKAAKLEWAGARAGKKQGWSRSRSRAEQEQTWVGAEQGRSRADKGIG